MQFELKPISPAGIGEALEKAERYRLLNEPSLAESICLDVLHIDPENQQALVMLLLALTDQFGHGAAAGKARELLPRLKGEYEQHYYAGIIWERLAHAQLRKGSPNGVFAAYDAFRASHATLRNGRSTAPRRKRRRPAALEHLCPNPDAQSKSPAPPRRSLSSRCSANKPYNS